MTNSGLVFIGGGDDALYAFGRQGWSSPPWKQADLSRHASIICEPDDAHAATLVACAGEEVGLRVFDISSPTRPVEIAYYKPPGRRTEARPGSGLSIRFSGADRTADWVIQVSRIDRERNEIWFMSQDNGLQIVRFTDRFRATRKDLFGSR